MKYGAGDLRERIRFDKRADQEDGYGNTKDAWEAQFTRSAMFLMKPGSESVLSERLQGRQPVTMIVRFDTLTALIKSDWRAVDTRTGIVYAIRAAEDMDRKRQWISIIAEAGIVA